MARQDQCKIQVHHLQAEAINGNVKSLALFYSLKHIYVSGYIKDWRKLNLSLVKHKISRTTYIKRINRLIQIGLVRTTGKDIQLIGQNAILRRYPLDKDENLKLIYLQNDQTLKESIEAASIHAVIKRENNAIKVNLRYKEKGESRKVFKTVNGEAKLCEVNVNEETSISQRETARLIGVRSRTTAYRRQRKWSKEKLFQINERVVNAAPEDLRQGVYGVFKKGSFVLRQLANEVIIRDHTFGRKQLVRSKDVPLVKCWATTDLFNEYF